MSIFSKAVAAGATDLHLESGGSVYMRRLGQLVFESACSSAMFAEINRTLQTAAALDDSIVNREAREVKDFSCALPDVGRLRVRRYLANGRECLAIRLLPQQIPEAEALGWPEAAAVSAATGTDPGHRCFWQRQIDNAGGDDRADQSHARLPYPHV